MISLRAPEPSDLDFLYRLECQPNVWRISWGAGPVSRQMLWDYLQHYSADIYRDKQMRWVISDADTSVGTIDITDFDPMHSRAMIGIAIDRNSQGRGLATQALILAIEYSRDVLHLHQLAAIVPRDNTRSMRLFERTGFKASGCLRSWLHLGDMYSDAVILQLML